MCIFSGKVESVSGTNIFARRTGKNKQALIYQMEVSSDKPVAMILPLPVKRPATEKSITFYDFSDYEDFFPRLDRVIDIMKKSAPSKKSASLVVHEVGSFEASFVPSIKDFDRLDERFRLPKEAWKSMPQYKNYGFAVFQLKEGDAELHPMAFEFKTREDAKLFFPTIHIHNGKKLNKTAIFDHRLYFQGAKTVYETKRSWFTMKQIPMLQGKNISSAAPKDWGDERRQFSNLSAHDYISETRACGLIKERLPAHRVTLRGRQANVDHWVSFVEPKKKKTVTKKLQPKKAVKRAAAKKATR